MQYSARGKVCILACVFWPIYPGFGGRHAYVLAENLLKCGYQVDVVTTFPIRPKGKGTPLSLRPVSREDIGGIRVLRVFSFLPTGPGIWRKFLLYTSFMFTSLLAIPYVGRAKLVLGLDPPAPFLMVPGFLFSCIFRAKYMIRVTDLWPDVVFDFDLARPRLLKGLVGAVSKIAYRLNDGIMAFTPRIRQRLLEFGTPETKVYLAEMAVDTSVFRPMPEIGEEAHTLGLPNPKDKFVVLYSGSFALTYDFETLLRAAQKLQEESCLFVLLGDGEARGEIVEGIRRMGLKNVLLLPAVTDPEKVARVINYADVCVIPLKPEMVTSTLTRPSKVFEFWGCGKPVISGITGDLEDLTHESGAGIVVEPGNADALCEAIRSLSHEPERAREMGRKGRDFVLQRFSYEAMRANLVGVLDKLSSN